MATNLQQELLQLKPTELQECLSALEMDTNGAKSVLVMKLVQYCVPLGIKSVSELKARAKAVDKAEEREEEVLISPQTVKVVTRSQSEKGLMSWEVHQFSFLTLAPGEKIKSSVFTVGKKRWQIHLYPCGDRDDKDHVTCYLHYLDDSDEEFNARWKAVFLTKSGESLRMPLELQFSFGKIKSRGWRGILLRKPNFLGPDDVLVVESELEVFSEWVTTDNNLQVPAPAIDCQEEMQSQLEELLREPELFSDVTLEVEGKSFPVHKNILSARSPVFRAMFTGGMRERSEKTIKIYDVDTVIFSEFIKFVYCGKFDEKLLHEKTIEVLSTANKYDVRGLKTKCETLLLQRVTKSTAASILMAADMYNAPYLKQSVINVITQNFLDVIGTDSFKELCMKAPALVTEITDHMSKSHINTGIKPSTSTIQLSEDSPLKRKRDG